MTKIVTNEVWKEIYFRIDCRRKNVNEIIDVGALLVEENYLPIFEKIDFKSTRDFKKLHFRGIVFVDCNFSRVVFSDTYFTQVNIRNGMFENVDLDGVVIKNSVFEDCDFSGLRMRYSLVFATLFIDSKFLNSLFQNTSLSDVVSMRCGFQEADYVKCSLRASFFSSCDFSDSSWYKCELKETVILCGKFSGVCFWENTNQNSSLVDSDLAECVMLENSDELITQNCTSPNVTRPVIAMAWNFNARADFAPFIARAIRDSGGIPLKIEVEPNEIFPELLQQEVAILISMIKDKGSTKILSIPSEMLLQASKDSEIGKIRTKVTSVLQFCSGLALPGGNDLQPEFYGAQRDDYTDPVKDYRRSIIEFALLFYANQVKLPTMGTCRGAQLINVYFGGTLIQHIDNQIVREKLQLVKLSESRRREEFLSYFGSEILPSFSAHHQAIDKVGENLEMICEFEGIPKLLLSPDNQYIASQIHPEVYVNVEKLPEDLRSAKWGRLIYQLFLEKVKQFHILIRYEALSLNL